MSQWSLVRSQTISRQVISNAGGTLSGGSNQITFNIGETVIPTFSSATNLITQGFEQPGEQIITGAVSLINCAGSNLTVSFTSVDILPSNIYTAQLSDAAGSFSSPVNIGTLAGNVSSGSINITIPLNTPPGNGYRVRVVGSMPLTNGSANAAGAITVLNPLAPVATGGTIYLGNSITLTATGCTGVGFAIKWYQTVDNLLVTMPVSPVVTTQYYAKCEQTAGAVTCTSVKSNDVTVTVVNRIFVDITKIAAPIQNGNSWATAYGNLQTGLSAAAVVVVSAPVEVWVAQGTYKPTTTTTRTIYFEIPNNVKVYGGFAGTENALNDHNFRTNQTILSGELGDPAIITDNTYHVLTFDGSSINTVLDGFIITRGNANLDPKTGVGISLNIINSPINISRGGGIFITNGASPVIANNVFTENYAVEGAGIFAENNSSPTITGCKFIGNRATFGSGVYLLNQSNAMIVNSLFSGNRANGAIYNNVSSPIITNCTISGNGGNNAAIFNSASQPIIKNSIIWGNAPPLLNNDNQSIITNSIIEGGYIGVGNLNYNPQFVNPVPEGLSPNNNGDYHLQASSLAIDRGNNTGISLIDKDLDGNLRRFAGGTVDMGAYEFQGVATSNIVISAQTGDWEINSTWVGFIAPQIGDMVIIDANHIVTINATAIAKNIEYRATGQVKFKTAVAKLNIGF